MLLEKEAAKTAAAPAQGKTLQVQPYLFFNGRCEEAVEFYRKAIGAEVQMLMRWSENPEPARPGVCAIPSGDKIMHACLKIGESLVMASDGVPAEKSAFQGISLSLSARDEGEADRLFAGLADGGQVHMPLSKTFFSPRFGVVADRFGVSWMVVTTP